jgi:hypothetical protein
MPVKSVIAAAFLLAVLGAAAPALAEPPTPAPAGVAQPTAPPAPGPNTQSSPGVPVPTPLPFQAFSVSGQKVAFYSTRYYLTADGNVEVRLPGGTRVTGSTFAMDVRLNRFVIAGGVKLYAGGQEHDGAAFADYLDFDRQYFVPVLSEPDRWTYTANDYAHPLLGREMPGDTFFLPDLSGARAFAYATKAVIQPRESIRFIHPSLLLGLVYFPFPSYFLEFGPNPNYAQNSLPGAYVDGPWDALGGGHALATGHLRYDPANKLFLAYEQHQISDKSYLVGSISPLTRPLKQYNLLGFDRLSPDFQVQASFQETNFQHAFSQPLSATAFASLQMTAGLPRSYLEWQSFSYYDSLLRQPPPGINGLLYYGDPSHNWVPNHPVDAQLTWHGFQNRIFKKLPVVFATRFSEGFSHDGITPPQDFGNVAYPTIWNKSLGLNVALPSYKLLRDHSGLNHDLYFNASFDKQREWFSVPHHVDTTISTASLSRQFDPKLIGLVAYTITNLGDFYGAQQNMAYSPTTVYTSPLTGLPVPSWSAFRGFGTQRSLVEQFVYTPTTYVAANLSFRQNRDFPEPLVGHSFQDDIGLEPYQATLDLRLRINPTVTLDVSRSYYFNFGGLERWSPTFQITVLP